jgi:multimeric flavodoxin WrbA
MTNDLTRREFLSAAGATAAAGVVAGAAPAGAANEEAKPRTIKILGICGSPRKGMTTAGALSVCLEAAKAVDPDRIETELIELAGMKLNGDLAAGVELAPGERDDFPSLVPKLSDPQVAGLVIGTPVYFANMSSLCKAFLERLIVFRKKDFALSNKVAGVLAVGGARNGGQELTIQSVKAALYGQEMIVVGESRPTAHFGPCAWNKKGQKKITDDEVGMAAVKNLGRRVAEVARLVAS